MDDQGLEDFVPYITPDGIDSEPCLYSDCYNMLPANENGNQVVFK